MKKRISILMIFLIGLQIVLPQFAPLQTAFSNKETERILFGFDGVSEDDFVKEEGKTYLNVEWALEDFVVEEIGNAIAFHSPFQLATQRGELAFNDDQVLANYEASNDVIYVTFNELASEQPSARGSVLLELLEDDEIETEYSDDESVGDIIMGEGLEQETNEQEDGFFVLSTNEEISENIINSVTIWTHPDSEGQPTDNSEQLEEVRAKTDEKLSIVFQWELKDGHGYSGGDYFNFQLPNKFIEGLDLDGQLVYEGTIIGVYQVTSDGQITFTFNNEINDGEGFEGDFYVWRQFDQNKWKGETKQELVFDFGGGATRIPVHFDKDSGGEITKSGQAKKDGTDNTRNSDLIEWVVDFNLNEEVVNRALFKDILPAGLILDEDSIEIYELVVNLDGTVNQSNEVTKSYTLVGNDFTIDFGSIDKAYRVKYSTEVPLPADEDPNYFPNYQNNVTVNGNEGQFSQSQNRGVSIQFNEPLNKRAEGYNAEEQEIEWVIDYNFNEQEITEPLIDTFETDHQELNIESFEVYEVTIDQNGNGTNIGNAISSSEYTVTETDTGFEFAFNNPGNQAYRIYYKTTAKNRVYLDNFRVENTVQIGKEGPKDTAERNIGQVIFNKGNGAIDYAAKTITWNLTVNRDSQEMENVVIEDTFANQGLTLDQGQFRINGELIDFNDSEVDYELSPNPTFEDGFKLELGNIEEVYVITYVTDFDPTYFDNEGGRPSYSNGAILDWDNKTENTPDMVKTGSVDPAPYMRDNGDKTVSYDATTKKLTWIIDINFNRHTIDEAVVRDFYSKGQNFVENSLKVFELEVDSGANGTVSPSNSFINYDFALATDNGNDGFILTFNEQIDQPYRITYKTSLEGLPVLKEYTNNATLHEADDPDKLLFSKDANVNPQHGNEYANKNVRQGTGNDQTTAYWTLDINRGQSFIENAVVTDTLSDNQSYYQDSFVLYKTIVNQYGNLTKGDPVDSDNYSIEFSVDTETWEESFVLTFAEEIEEAYILEYKTFINAKHGEQISNQATVAGHETSDATDSTERNHTASFQDGAGGSVYANGGGELVLQKVDAADQVLVLEDAVFELYDETGTNFLETITTDENGLAKTSNKYKYGRYLLKEITPPEGYVINSEYEAGKVIIFDEDGIYALDQDGNKEDNTYTFTNELGVWEFELTKVDADNSNQVLAGAEFKLQEKIDENFVDLDPQPAQDVLTTNSEGKLRLTLVHVETNKEYRLVEIAAPVGYLLAKDEADRAVEFIIADNQVVLATDTLDNEAVTGSVRLLKRDDQDETPLLNAEFNLEYNAGGTGDWQFVSSHTTNEQGLIEVSGLKGGQYRFIETTAPEDYQLDQEPIEFIIEENNLSHELEVENTLIPGSVELTKLGADGNLLTGVTFELQDSDNNTIKDDLVTDENGVILVEDLRPGHYQFIEVATIPGYELNNHIESFEITRSQAETLLVTFTNELTPGTVQLTKVGEENEPLQGAVFNLLDESGSILQQGLTTGEDGLIQLTLSPGKYQFVEIEAPFGHDLDSTAIEFEIEFDQNQSFAITKVNERTTSGVELVKTGEDGNVLEGVVFNIVDENDEIIREDLTTDEHGVIQVDGLKPGIYYFVETDTIAGYDSLKEPIKFEIELGQAEFTAVEAVNELTTGSVRLIKIGEEGETLESAVFSLINEDEIEVVSNLVTNEDGIVEVDDLKPGTYYFVETEAPFGHDLDETPIEVVVEFDQQEIAEVTKENQRTTSGVELVKTGEDGNVLGRVVFNIVDENGDIVREDLITDEHGVIQVDGLKPGIYYFVETDTIDGYDLDQTPIEFEIELGQTEFTEVAAENKLTTGSVRLIKIGEEDEPLEGAIFNLINEDEEEFASDLITNEAGIVEVDDLKPGTYYFVETKAPFGHDLDETPIEVVVEFDQQEIAEVTKENQRTTSGVELTKVDNETGIILENATFELQHVDGELISKHTTNEAGQIVIDGLKPGNYQFVEIESPEGYQKDPTPIPFTIALGQVENLELTTDNQIIKGGLVLTKVDSDDGFVLEGVEFELQTVDGEMIESGLKTDENGQLVIIDLRPGDYQLVETVALNGYDIIAEPIQFTIHLGQLTHIEIELTNRLTRGSVILHKTDEDGNGLKNAVFDLQTEDGATIESGLITDQAGYIHVENLKPGIYYFIEIESPEGYLLDEEPIEFEVVKGQEESLQIEVINEKERKELEITEDPELGEKSDNDQTKTNDEDSLPKTATTIYNMLLISLAFILVATVLFIINKHRNRSAK